MVGYNQNQPDVWGSFAGGMEIGGALRRRQQQQEYGQAYQQGGWESVRDTAGGFGDLETAQGAGEVMDQQEETALARATRSAQIAQRLHRSLTPLDENTRRERLAQLAPQLEQYGFDAQTVAGVDTSEAGWAALGQSLDAAVGQFQEFQDIQTAPDGAVIGIRRDGSQQVLREPPPPAWGPPQEINGQLGQQNSRTGQIQWAPAAVGQAPQRPLTPEEAEAWGVGDPAGWAVRDGEAPTPVGGAAALRQRFNMSNRQRTRLQALYQQTTSNEIVLRDIARARQLAPRGAGISSMAAVIPGTDAANLSALIDTIGANIGFDRLQQMRDSSPTGGALGQVTERELALLQAVYASLQQSQSDEQFIENLNNLERTYNAAMERIRQAYFEDFGEEPPMMDTGATGGDGSVAGSIAGIAGSRGAAQSTGGSQVPGGIPREEWDAMTPEEQRQVMDILGAQ